MSGSERRAEVDPSGFFPSGARARTVDRRMRALLGDSLEHIAEQAGHLVLERVDDLRRLATRLSVGERMGPEVFGLYTDSCLALARNDTESASALLIRLASLADAPALASGFDVVLLGAADFAPDRERFERLMGFREADAPRTAPPSAHAVARFMPDLDSALAMLRDALPEYAAEADSLVRKIVLVTDGASGVYRFDAGSCYMLWGAMFLNVGQSRTRLELLRVLVHEVAHMLLFGFAADEPLVHNDDVQRYASPLRDDLRPMDGILHAAYVTARMHWATQALVDRKALPEGEREEARRWLEIDTVNFEGADSVICQHGQLSATGEAAIASARYYMSEAGSMVA